MNQHQQEQIKALAIPYLKDIFLYTKEISKILGRDVTLAKPNSFADRGYFSNRPFLGYGQTANSKWFKIYSLQTFKQKELKDA